MSFSGPQLPPPPSWFASGGIDRRKLDDYLLSPTHPDGKHKLRLWDRVFGIGVGDGKLLERLILQQVASGVVTERPSHIDARHFGVVIPDFQGRSGRGPRSSWRSSRPRIVVPHPPRAEKLGRA